MALTGKQTRHLRSLGHHLDPIVQIGKNGITEAVVAQLAEAIEHHELVKVRLLPECPVDRLEAGAELAGALGAELAQTLGRTLLLWKRNPQKAKVELPNARGELRSAAHRETSKGKLPPSRARSAGEGPRDEGEKPRRFASGEGPAAKRGAKPRAEGDTGAPARRAARPRAEGDTGAPARRAARPRAEGDGRAAGKQAGRPRAEGGFKGPSRARNARSGGEGGRPTAAPRRPAPRRAR